MGNAAIKTIGGVLDDTLDATRELVNKIEKTVSAHVEQLFEAEGVLAVTADNKVGFFGRLGVSAGNSVVDMAEGEAEFGLDLNHATLGELDTKITVRVVVTLDRPALRGPGVE